MNFKYGQNFITDGKVYLVRCENCHCENWSCAVAAGYCAFCGYDAQAAYNEELKAKSDEHATH